MVVSRKERRFNKISHKKSSSEKKAAPVEVISNDSNKKQNFFARIYEHEYKKLAIIPIVMLVLAFIAIGINVVQTGDFMNKGVSLKGGITITVPSDEPIDILELETILYSAFPQADMNIREISELGTVKGVMIEADIGPEERTSLISVIEAALNVDSSNYSVEEVGPSLGSSFFKQTMIAILIAFLFMGLVVFAYFKTFIPSIAVILAAFSDIVVTLAIVNIIGMKISTAGIAAFLMLIGYSVDTDILLSTRVLRRKEGTVMSRIYSAMKTGLTMNLTTIIAVSIALIISDSEVIRQIMTIILIGLLVDIINTWIQNVSILRLYLEKKSK